MMQLLGAGPGSRSRPKEQTLPTTLKIRRSCGAVPRRPQRERFRSVSRREAS
jgi:hypothetical protein